MSQLTDSVRAEAERRGDWYGGTVDAICRFLDRHDAAFVDHSLTFQAFDEGAIPLKTPDGPLLLWATGLGEESAEVAGALLDVLALIASIGRAQGCAKKIVRDGDGPSVHGEVRDLDAALLKEAGDVLFYLNQVLKRRGLTLEQAAMALLVKLDGMRP